MNLEDCTDELASSHRALGDLLAAEREGRIRAFFDSQESSLGARERVADMIVLDLSCEILRLKGTIAALEVEHRYLLSARA